MSARIVSDPAELRSLTEAARRRGERVAVVPTMGALHEGHLALVREARRRAELVVVTIFVNPTQFGAGEDFDAYPRDLERDVELAESAGAALVFAPRTRDMYPEGDSTRVRVSGLTEVLCGRSRPGHFEGVATVVTKLLCLVGPSVAIFGRKDFQQLQVIRRFVQDLFLPVEIVGFPLVREASGLAMSSRNAYLEPKERERAHAVVRALVAAGGAFAQGEREARVLREVVRGALDRAGLRVDYVELAQPDSLKLFPDGEQVPERVLLAVAAFCGKTRLIDNIVLGEEELPYLPEALR